MNYSQSVTCVISDDEIIHMDKQTPLSIQIRNKLNEKGIKFKDDGKISSIINEIPIPIGELRKWYDIEKRATYYKQIFI